MAAGPSDPPVTATQGRPGFARTLRGYLPAEVDAHLARLNRELSALQASVSSAETARAEAAADAQAAVRQAEAARSAAEGHAAELAEQVAAARAAQERAERATAAGPPEHDHAKAAQQGPAGPAVRHAAVTGGLARPTADRRAVSPAVLAIAAALVLLLVAGIVAVLLQRDDGGTGGSPTAGGASSTPPTTSSQAAVAPVTGDPVVPEGWRTYATTDGSTLAVPPEWKQEGIGSGVRYVSASGMTEVTLSSAPATDPEDVEHAFAAAHVGYERTDGQDTSFRGRPAYVWDYTVGEGELAARGSDLAVLGGGLGYQLHVQSRVATWASVEPLLAAIRGSFSPAV